MDRQQLEYFQTIARLEHFTKAAEQLNVTQPALSASIRRLEAELGIILFNRHGRNVTLSECGQTYLQYVDAILQKFEEADAALDVLREARGKDIRLLSPPLEHFPGLLESMLSTGASLSLESINDTEESIIDKFASKQIDLCVTTIPITTPFLSKCPLTNEEMVLVASKDHQFAPRSSVSIHELKHIPFAAFRSGTGPRQAMESTCMSAGFTPQIKFTGDRLEDILKAIAVGGYVTLLTRESHVLVMNERKEEFRKQFVIVPLQESWCSMSRALYWRENDARPSVARLREVIITYFRNKTADEH